MKKVKISLSIAAVMLVAAVSIQATSSNNVEEYGINIEAAIPGDWVYIDLQNDCSSDIKYTVKSKTGGTLTGGSVNAKSKKRHTAKTDSKFYVNGKLIGTASEDQDRKTWVICK